MLRSGNQKADCAPFLVVYPGESRWQAMQRHRRETGYTGALFVVAVGDRLTASPMAAAA